MKYIRAQLRTLKSARQEINPRKEWVEKSREMIFSQIQNSIGATPVPASWSSSLESFAKFFFPPRMYHVVRVSLVFALAIGITIGGWIGGVSASHNCLPGDFCYNVKLAAEKTQVVVAAVTSSKDKQVALHMEFASRRLSELRQVKTDHKVEALQGLKKSLASAATTLQEVQETDPQKAAEVAKDISKQTTDIVRTLTDTGGDVSDSIDTTKEIVDTTKIVNETGLQALEIAIAAQTENGSVPTDEIKAIVEDKINLILDTDKSTQQSVSEVKNTLQNTLASSSSVPTFSSDVVSTTMNSSTLSNTEVGSATSSVNLADAVTKAEEKGAEVQNVANEAKALLSDNNVDKALEKVKTLNTIVTETQQQFVQAKEAVEIQTPLPVTSTTLQTSTTTE